MRGEEISFSLRDMVYPDSCKDGENIFNILLSTGYLTCTSHGSGIVHAKIPNRDVHKIFKDKIGEWFHDTLPDFDVRGLYHAMEEGRPEQVEEILTGKFLSSFPFYDTLEAFYHGVVLTLLRLNPDYEVTSNQETGSGGFCVQSKSLRNWNLAFVLGFKISADEDEMLADAEYAATQIKDRAYATGLLRVGYRRIITYGISFFSKCCRVIPGSIQDLPPPRDKSA
jgi:hypothetical protein